MPKKKNKSRSTAEDVMEEQIAAETTTATEAPEKTEETSTEKDLEDFSLEEALDHIITVKDDMEELKLNLQRERADFTNFRKRTILEKADLEQFIMGRILTELLPAFDSFDQLLSNSENDEDKNKEFITFVEGAELIKKQLLDVVQNFGVEFFNPEGEEFDPLTMLAISMRESETVDKAQVEQVYQKGYKIGDKVIREARVMVVQPIELMKEEEIKEEIKEVSEEDNKEDNKKEEE